MSERILNWEGCMNVRDLGGLRTCNGGLTRWGQSYVRIAPPGSLQPDGQRYMPTASVPS